MANFIDQYVLSILVDAKDPLTNQRLFDAKVVSDLQYLDGRLSMKLTLGYPGKALQNALVQSLSSSLLSLPNVEKVVIDAGWAAPIRTGIAGKKPLQNVRNVIAVASGKGGVGKSTTTVNLALALTKLGANVGILDADIYGPSQAQMLGASGQRPEIRDEKVMLPVVSHGIQSMSMGYLLTENTPAVWRGPMATGALQQLLFQTQWRDLDYLFVDMPPGTGDIQLTLAQQVPVSGAVIVTTPQDIALLDARKAIEMFTKVNVPVLGIVENMAVYRCSHCGHEEHIFGEGGGQRIADDYNSQLLGALPLALSIREHADSGNPSVIAEPDSDISRHYLDTAQKSAAVLWANSLQSDDLPEIIVSDD